MRKVSRSWIAVIVAVTVVGSVAAPPAQSLANDKAKPDVFNPGKATRGSHDVPEPQGDFGQGRGRHHEVVSMRTRQSNTYVTADGSYETELFPGAVNYMAPDGRFLPIDNTLEADASAGGLRNKGNAYTLHLPRRIEGAPARIEQEGFWLSYTLDGASGPAVIEGRTATYEDAFPGVDVRITAQNEQVKEELVLASPQVQSAYDYTLRLDPRLSARIDSSGGIEVNDSGGVTRFVIPPPVAYDSADEPALAQGLAWKLQDLASGRRLSVELDRGWLDDPARVFPVILDPTISQPLTAQRDCTISGGSSSWANYSQCNTTPLEVGPGGGAGGGSIIFRSILRFNMGQTDASGNRIIPPDAHLVNAQLGMYLESTTPQASQNPTKPQLLLRRLNTTFTNNATWNNYDGTNAWTTNGNPSPGGDFDSKFGYDGPDPTINGGNNLTLSSGFKNWWHPTALVASWLKKESDNHGIVIKQPNDTTTPITTRLSFTSMEGVSSQLPRLTLTWEPGGVGKQRNFTYAGGRLSDRMQAQVNVAGGNLLVEANDLNIKGTGMDLQVSRYFNGLVNTQGLGGSQVLGNGWTLNVGKDVGLQFPTGGASAIYYAPGGARLPFTRKGFDSNEFISPPGVDADLKREATDGTYTLSFHKTLEKYKFSSGGLLTSQVDKNGNTISFQYNMSNILWKIIDTQGGITTFTYNGGKLTQISDPSSPARVYSFGYTNGNLTSYTDPKNFTTSYEYDASNRLTKITDPLGNQTKFGYGSSRAVTSITRQAGTDANGNPVFHPATTFAYDLNPTNPAPPANGCCRSTVTDPNNHVTTYDYGTDGRVVKVKDAKNRTTSTTYTPQANVETYSNAMNGRFQFKYDQSSGEALTQTDTFQSSSQSTGDLGGKVLYEDNRAGHEHLPTCTLDSENHQVYFKYDVPGNLTDVYLGATGNLAGGPGGASTDCGTAPTASKSHYVYTYNTKGLVATITDGRGNQTTYNYDQYWRLEQIVYPGSGQQATVTYTYDSLNRVVTMSDANGTTGFSYDALDRLTQITYPGGTSVVYTYDANGNLTQRTDAVGQTTFDYTPKNELKKRSSSVGTSEFTYDAVGNLKTLKETPAGASPVTTTYDYDAVNVLSQVTEPGGGTITFQTNDNNKRTQTTLPNGNVWHAHYANTGEMDRVWAEKSSGGAKFFDYRYDYRVLQNGSPSGPKTSRIQLMTDELNGSAPFPKTEYTYDAANRLTKAITSGYASPNTNLNKTFDYSYDANSNISRTIESGAQDRTFDHNAVNELVCERPTGTGAFGCPDPLGSGQTRYGYDGNGNLSSIKTSSGTTFITNNAKNQMTNYGASAGGTGGTTMTYGDANSTERATKGSTSYSYDLLGLASEKTGTDARIHYTRDDKAKRLGMRTSGGNYYHLTDVIGSVVAVTGPTGDRVGNGNYRYDPFGGLIGGDPLLNSGLPSFRFAGGYFDSESKFLKFGTRYYAPSIARWTQQDPEKGQLTEPMSLNPYLYVENDPINSVDPMGREATSCISGLLGVLGGVTLASLGIAVILEASFIELVQPELFPLVAEMYVVGGSAVIEGTDGTINSAQTVSEEC